MHRESCSYLFCVYRTALHRSSSFTAENRNMFSRNDALRSSSRRSRDVAYVNWYMYLYTGRYTSGCTPSLLYGRDVRLTKVTEELRGLRAARYTHIEPDAPTMRTRAPTKFIESRDIDRAERGKMAMLRANGTFRHDE